MNRTTKTEVALKEVAQVLHENGFVVERLGFYREQVQLDRELITTDFD